MSTVTTLTDFNDSEEQTETTASSSRYPIESNGTTLFGTPHCPECDEIGSYEGAGSTTVSNWTGRSFTVRYCSDCDLRYHVHAAANESPTIN